MEPQDHNKTHSSGTGSHGVHVCNKCNWPFPNSHPSAKQRRAHKKICGTVEGYKLVLSDEHHSDEDHKSPTVKSPSVVESTSSSRTVTEHGAFSTRSDYEGFSDARNHFSESSSGDKSGILVDKVVEKHLSPAQSFKECPDTDLVEATKSEKYTVENMKPDAASENDEVTLEKHPCNDVLVLDEHVDRALETTMEFERRSETNLDMLVGGDSNQFKHEYNTVESTPSIPIGEVVEKEAHQKRDEEIVSDSGPGNVMAVTCEPAAIMQECAGESASDVSTSEAVEKEAHHKGDREVVSDSSLENVMGVTSVHSETRQDHAGESASCLHINEVVEKEALHKGENEIAVTSEYASESDSSMPTNQDTEEEAHHKGDKTVSESGLQNVMEVTNEHADSRKEDAGGQASRLRTGEYILEKAPQNGDKEMFPGSMLEKISEVSLKSKKRKEMTLVIENAGETVQSEEERRHIFFASKTANSVLTPAESVEPQTDIADTVSEKLDVAAQAELAKDRKDEGDETAHVLMVSSDIPAIENMKTMLEGFKDHKRMKFQRSAFTCSGDELKGEIHEMKDPPKETAIIPDEIKDLSSKEAASISQSTELTGKGNLLTEEVLTESKSTIQNNEVLFEAEREVGQETYALSDSLQDINCSEEELTDHFPKCRADDHDRSLRNVHEVALSDNNESVQEENYVSNSVVPSDSATDLSRTEAGDLIHGKTDEGDVDKIGSEEPMIGDLSGGTNSTSKSFSSHEESRITMEGKDDEQADISTNSQTMNLVRVYDCEDEGSVETKTSADTLKKESLDFHTDADLHACILPLADKNLSEFDDSFVKHHLDSSATEFSVESGSQTDSLEAYPGSVSVLSNLSDIPAATETGVLKSRNLQPSAEVEGAKLKNQEAASSVHHKEKSEEFEPPSFMTLVEPGAGDRESVPTQLDATPLRAGWFPSIASAPNESPGRKKNEEIIAKVTNWNMNQEHHTPLKSLLGKASAAQAKASSPNRKENQPLLAREPLFDEPGGTTEAAAKEWNSPARYPADIKRERRKAKGRPYWAQFVCCSSVH